jgi:hypothetical protein
MKFIMLEKTEMNDQEDGTRSPSESKSPKNDSAKKKSDS